MNEPCAVCDDDPRPFHRAGACPVCDARVLQEARKRYGAEACVRAAGSRLRDLMQRLIEDAGDADLWAPVRTLLDRPGAAEANGWYTTHVASPGYMLGVTVLVVHYGMPPSVRAPILKRLLGRVDVQHAATRICDLSGVAALHAFVVAEMHNERGAL